MLPEELTITIPAGIKRALKIPEQELASRLRLELAVHLYEETLLSFGKALELAQISRWEVAHELTKREIVRHYSEKDFDEDLAYATAIEGSYGR